MKTRSIKTKKPFKTIVHISDEMVTPGVAEYTPEIEKNKINLLKNSKFHQYFLKTNIFTVIRDIR